MAAATATQFPGQKKLRPAGAIQPIASLARRLRVPLVDFLLTRFDVEPQGVVDHAEIFGLGDAPSFRRVGPGLPLSLLRAIPAR